jgi:hypothetical protein
VTQGQQSDTVEIWAVVTSLLPREEDLRRDCGWNSDYEALRELNCIQKKAVMILYGEMLDMDIVRLIIGIWKMLL